MAKNKKVLRLTTKKKGKKKPAAVSAKKSAGVRTIRRDAGNGRVLSAAQARKRPAGQVVTERMGRLIDRRWVARAENGDFARDKDSSITLFLTREDAALSGTPRECEVRLRLRGRR